MRFTLFCHKVLVDNFFLFLVISNGKLHDMSNRFFMYSKSSFHLDPPTKDIEFQHRPNYKRQLSLDNKARLWGLSLDPFLSVLVAK